MTSNIRKLHFLAEIGMARVCYAQRQSRNLHEAPTINYPHFVARDTGYPTSATYFLEEKRLTGK